MDISLAAARQYGAARPLTAPDAAGASPNAPGRALGQMARSFAETLMGAETASRAAMSGQGDPHALVGAITEAQLAVETVVAVRDRVVEAYMEILRMPV